MHPQSTTVSAVSGIYRITNTVTGDCYIGSSNNIRERWSSHRRMLRQGLHYNPHLQAAWDSGSEILVCAVLLEVAPDQLLAVEQAYLDREQPPYNISTSARGPRAASYSEHSRALMAAAKTGKKRSPESIAKSAAGVRGRPLSAQHKARIGAAHLGTTKTPETRAKLSLANKQRENAAEIQAKATTRAAEVTRGCKRSEETKARMSAARREWWRQQKKE
jgi:group I intron endonuclease